MVIDIGNYEDEQEEDSGGGGSDPEPDNDSGGGAPVRDEDGDFVRTVDDIAEAEGTDTEDSGGGGSTTVVVPDNPAEREKLKESDSGLAVGSGDTVEEAERDAARNPNFDADQGDSVNKVEEELGTNQPLQNPEGSSPEAVQDALKDVAREKRGSRAGRKAGAAAQAIEQAQNRGNAQILTDNNNFSVISRTRKEKLRDAQNNTTTVQRTGSKGIDLDGNPDKTTIGERLFEAGRKGTLQAQQTAKTVQRNPKVAEFLAGDPAPSQAIVSPPNPFNIISTGLALDNELENNDTSVRDTASLFTSVESPAENRAEATIGSDLIQDTIEDTSAVVGGIGASSAIARDNLRDGNVQDAAASVGAASAAGIGKQAEVLRNNPDELRQEAVGLVGDATPFGLTTIAPTASVRSSVSDSLQTAKNVGSEVSDLRANAKASKPASQQIFETAALNQVNSQTQQTSAVATESTPATENPIAQPDTSGITQESNFVPNNVPEPLDLQTGTSTTPSSNTGTGTSTVTEGESDVFSRPGSDALNRPESDTLNRPEENVIDIPSSNNKSTASASSTSSAATSSITASRSRPENALLPDPSSSTSVNINSTGGESDDDDDSNILEGTFGGEKDTVYSASVGSELAGVVSEEEPENFQDPTALRPIVEENNNEDVI